MLLDIIIILYVLVILVMERELVMIFLALPFYLYTCRLRPEDRGVQKVWS